MGTSIRMDDRDLVSLSVFMLSLYFNNLRKSGVVRQIHKYLAWHCE